MMVWMNLFSLWLLTTNFELVRYFFLWLKLQYFIYNSKNLVTWVPSKIVIWLHCICIVKFLINQNFPTTLHIPCNKGILWLTIFELSNSYLMPNSNFHEEKIIFLFFYINLLNRDYCSLFIRLFLPSFSINFMLDQSFL